MTTDEIPPPNENDNDQLITRMDAEVETTPPLVPRNSITGQMLAAVFGTGD